MTETMKAFGKEANRCAEEIRKHRTVHVVSHIDADGLTSAGIICTALERGNFEYTTRFVKQLDEKVLDTVADENHEFVIFTDLGSGMCEQIKSRGISAVVSDHHQPQGNLDLHLNPHLFGANGSYELSGSGTTYLLASALGKNRDLSPLAIVGAVGDMQHLKMGQLVGINRQILEDGVQGGYLEFKKDLTLFGKQTRPVYKLLQYSSDPYLPGLTGNEEACIEFLHTLNVRYSQDERWVRWIDLKVSEKQKIVTGLFQYCLRSGIPSYRIERLIGEVYVLLNEREGTEMRDASEFSTLLNATARYDHADIGLAVCMGDRESAYEEARKLLAEHRQNLVNGLVYVKENGITQLENIQYFDAGSQIKETIVGIIAGMSSTIVENRNLPIIAFANTEGGIKVSARGTQDLIRRGVNLSEAMSTVSAEVGGAGGGHDIAAGATIPVNMKEDFARKLDIFIGKQLQRKTASR
ncbi:Single-stranded-DNA-specific exonuclease RecJ [Methanosarcina siciliae T4/M]|uniref:Single-stranded-DNA-specific exonuclease RecJ n=2 Tax=Methanosarcina siciliae TaxID=38027 RepID=A0A0E3PB00_9EURY|nr:DHH family phosphoesterase [Methanosarcina siciliae]AKB27452.1 Single-stranded-DNA-specific exonuclease RecJ [Methanosarcina siciliae T4/M]AKB31395.1 Single-stranded-DNA-specific exonuclease RecJ [Methanosarcina siciliae HI350]